MEPWGWMKGTWVVVMALGVTAASCTLQSGGQAPRPLPASEPAVATKATVQAAYGNLPLSFEANEGQSDAQVQFLARGHGYSLFLTPSEAVLALRQPSGPGESAKRGLGESETPISEVAWIEPFDCAQDRLCGIQDAGGRDSPDFIRATTEAAARPGNATRSRRLSQVVRQQRRKQWKRGKRDERVKSSES